MAKATELLGIKTIPATGEGVRARTVADLQDLFKITPNRDITRAQIEEMASGILNRVFEHPAVAPWLAARLKWTEGIGLCRDSKITRQELDALAGDADALQPAAKDAWYDAIQAALEPLDAETSQPVAEGLAQFDTAMTALLPTLQRLADAAEIRGRFITTRECLQTFLRATDGGKTKFQGSEDLLSAVNECELMGKLTTSKLLMNGPKLTG